MIVKKVWTRQRGPIEWMLEGWYLFGFLPLYVRDCAPRSRRR